MRRVTPDLRNVERERAMMVNYIRAMVAQGTRSEWIDKRAEEYRVECDGPCPVPLPKGYPCPCSDWERYQAL
jgi:hypothetical protein